MATNELSQRRAYGGFNLGSAFFGWLVATAVAVLLTALLTATGAAVAVTQQVNNLTDNLPTVGLLSGLALLLALAVAYYAGGYVAGRMSRFNGGRQGFGVWVMGVVMTVVLAAAGAVLGASYNLVQQLNLPHIPVNQGSLTSGGLFTLLLTLAVTLLAAYSGGKVGENYHRKVDEAGEVADENVVYTSEPIDTRAQPSFGERIERTDPADRLR